MILFSDTQVSLAPRTMSLGKFVGRCVLCTLYIMVVDNTKEEENMKVVSRST